MAAWLGWARSETEPSREFSLSVAEVIENEDKVFRVWIWDLVHMFLDSAFSQEAMLLMDIGADQEFYEVC